MSSRKFIIEKESEWKNGNVDNWYYIKLVEDDKTTTISMATNEEEANRLFESAVANYSKPSRTIIREHEVKENK